jgi:LytS/YehU family sensor histidine kinase
MLVENAIKHNIVADEMPLAIEIKLEDGFVTVTNNHQRKRTTHPGKKPLGLENLRNRYTYLSDTPVEIIESAETFVVKLPVIKA